MLSPPHADGSCFCHLSVTQSEQVSRLVKVHGIIISATAVKAKATKVCLQCRSCRAIINNIPLPPGLQGYALPRKCNRWVCWWSLTSLDRLPQLCHLLTSRFSPQREPRQGEMSCRSLLHHPRPLRLCRLPDAAPARVSGCRPTRRDAPSPAALLRQVKSRFLKWTFNPQRLAFANVLCFFFLFCFYKYLLSPLRYLCDRVVPGNRVTIMGIYSIKKMAAAKAKGKEKSVGVGIRASYLRVVGIQMDTEGAGEICFLQSCRWRLIFFIL